MQNQAQDVHWNTEVTGGGTTASRTAQKHVQEASQGTLLMTAFLVMQRSRSKSTKNHRKKHMQPAPSNSEALNLMSSVYSAAGESLVKTNRQHGTAACKAEQEYSGEDAECV